MQLSAKGQSVRCFLGKTRFHASHVSWVWSSEKACESEYNPQFDSAYSMKRLYRYILIAYRYFSPVEIKSFVVQFGKQLIFDDIGDEQPHEIGENY